MPKKSCPLKSFLSFPGPLKSKLKTMRSRVEKGREEKAKEGRRLRGCRRSWLACLTTLTERHRVTITIWSTDVQCEVSKLARKGYTSVCTLAVGETTAFRIVTRGRWKAIRGITPLATIDRHRVVRPLHPRAWPPLEPLLVEGRVARLAPKSQNKIKLTLF